jgi:repressor of nif and glnA expression
VAFVAILILFPLPLFFQSDEFNMKRSVELMDSILVFMVRSPEAQFTTNSITSSLNLPDSNVHVVRHHLYLLHDRGLVQPMEGGAWRLTDAGHDEIEGKPEKALDLSRFL